MAIHRNGNGDMTIFPASRYIFHEINEASPLWRHLEVDDVTGQPTFSKNVRAFSLCVGGLDNATETTLAVAQVVMRSQVRPCSSDRRHVAPPAELSRNPG